MVVVIKKGSSKKNMEEVLKKLRKRRGFPAHKLCGTVKFSEDALIIQKRLRDEWE